jgi:hypothetical protein
MIYFGTSTTSAGHYWWDRHMRSAQEPTWCKRGEPPVFGATLWTWTLFHVEGHTVLSAPGSIRDRRRGTQTCFTEPGTLTMQVMIDLIKAEFPHIWEVIPIKPEVTT